MTNDIFNQSTLIETLLPKDTNAAGHIFGGVVMSLMDKSSAVTALRFCKKRVVTASADQITFHSPIYVGEVLESKATLVYTGKSSMDIEVIVKIENIMDGTSRIGASGFFTMVAVNEDGKPSSVPAYQPETDEARKKYQQAIQRRQAKGLIK